MSTRSSQTSSATLGTSTTLNPGPSFRLAARLSLFTRIRMECMAYIGLAIPQPSACVNSRSRIQSLPRGRVGPRRVASSQPSPSISVRPSPNRIQASLPQREQQWLALAEESGSGSAARSVHRQSLCVCFQAA
ncbi:hypothetical protein L1887_58071 [Cichorium endivia]|nr:hypothetical protein L1887_58071 [Cichorium endivia]